MTTGMRRWLLVVIVLLVWRAGSAQTVRVDTTHATNAFVPTEALGAGIDRIPSASVDKMFANPTVDAVLSAGWQTITYRQNTELFVEDWHWNPEGTWSDPSGKGYFTGNGIPGKPILHSFGYPLPHRGFTRNDGTGNSGYSRLSDGNLNTYWKSNPYLTAAFTGEDDSLHPQWIVVDLATAQEVDAIRIAWAEPYAREFLVQYWTGDDAIKQPTKGTWVAFPGGVVQASHGGTQVVRLAPTPANVRFVRIWMTKSSGTCDSHGPSDRRNCAGYAIREVYLGTATADGQFHDAMRHTPDQDQTTTYCSSVDPWHEASNLGTPTREQVGLDLFFTSRYTRGLPSMIPVSMLYGTPEDAAAEIAYVKRRGYRVSYIEMGEEPDGQYMLPEDYGALYLQWASAIHRVDPQAKLGGPVFTGVNEDILAWPNGEGKVSWTRRFVDYLREHGRLQDLAFFSFEHYPYEPCKVSWASLYDEPRLVRHIMQVWREDGVPSEVPLFITESNISWNTGESFVDIFGALWLAEYVGAFFDAGGNALYYFHDLPLGLYAGCNESMGTFGLFTSKNYDLGQPTSQYFASQLINLEWVEPGNGVHRSYPAQSDLADAAGHKLVSAYALSRPDKKWSLMLVNRDQENDRRVRVVFTADGAQERYFAGPVDRVTFGAAQYQWHPTEKGGFAQPDGPAVKTSITADKNTLYVLPKASITILRGSFNQPR